ncbi:MAG TPA: hypothetical protein V6C65_26150 [Allocoleopsis sp.]
METNAPVNNPAPNHPELQGRVDPAKDGDQAKDQGQKQETQQQKEKRLLKTKINGREVEVDEETVIKRYQKEETADQKLREAAQMRREVESFYETLLNNPEEILNDPRIPLKKRELAEKWLMDTLSQELGEPEDPRDKKLKEVEGKLKTFEEREAEAKAKAEQEEFQQVVNTRREQIAKTLTAAIQQSPLAQDPDTSAATIKEMAMYMKMCRDAKYDVTPEEIAAHVEKKHNKSIQHLVGKLKGEQLIRYLGQDIINEVRRYDLQQLQKSRELPQAEQASSWEPREKRQREFVDPNSLRRR